MSEDKFSELNTIALKYWSKKIQRSIFKMNPFFKLIQVRARKRKIIDIQAILTAEINSFRKLTKDKKVHIAIKILKVTNQW